MLTGYKCYLTVTERGKIKDLVKTKIRQLTQLGKCDTLTRNFVKQKKKSLAKIYSKMEHLNCRQRRNR